MSNPRSSSSSSSNSRTRQLPGRLSTKNETETAEEYYPSRRKVRSKLHHSRTLVSSLVCWITLLGNFHNVGATELQTNITYKEPIEPSECLESGEQLLRALKDYYSLEHSKDATQLYGWPVQTWCVNEWVQELLQNGPLDEGVHDVLENIDVANNSTTNTNVDDLISGWMDSAPNSLCLDLCAQEENPTGTLNPTHAFTSTGSGSSTLVFDEDSYNVYNTKSVDDIDNYNDENIIDDNIIEDSYNTEPYQQQSDTIEASNSADEHVPTTIHKEPTTTKGMLFRLIPVKLVAVLFLMCVILWVRQMVLHSDDDESCFIFKIMGTSSLSSRGHTYQGILIDPSDLSKSVDFEMLQLAASGDGDLDLDVDIEIS